MKTPQRLLSGCLLALLTGCPSANDPYRRYVLSNSNNLFGFLSGVPRPPPYVPSNPPTRGFPLNFEAAWSPDGQQLAILAFANTYGEYMPLVYLTDVASGKVTSSWTIRNPAELLLLYSPVATEAQSDPGRTRIVSVALNDGQHETLFESEHIQLRQARLSPDGQKLLAGLSQFTATPDSLGAASRQTFPLDSQPDKGLALTQLSLDSRRSNWFSQQLNLSGSVFWHGNEQFLAGQTSQTSDDSWILWDLPSQSIKARYSRPELGGLKPGQTLALAPYPKLHLAVSLYNPCCTLKNLRTGVHLWDLERRRFTRVGPDIATLVKDFPWLAIHDQTIYGSSAERTNYTSGSARTP